MLAMKNRYFEHLFVFLLSQLEKSYWLMRLVRFGVTRQKPKPIIEAVIRILFVNLLGANIVEAKRDKIKDYHSVLDFFTRELKTNARKITPKSALISPSDGKIFSFGKLKKNTLTVKGSLYQVDELLGMDKVGLSGFAKKGLSGFAKKGLSGFAKKQVFPFVDGFHTTIYLSPKDYHRVHCPANALLKKIIVCGNGFFPVNAFSNTHFKKIFSKNRRFVFVFENRQFDIALVMVTALNVGIITLPKSLVHSCPDITYRHGQLQSHIFTKFKKKQFKQGEEIGTFELGSTVVLMWKSKQKKSSLKKNYFANSIGLENKIQMGQSLLG